MRLRVLQWWPYRDDENYSIVVGAYNNECQMLLAKAHIQETFGKFEGIDVSENAFDETFVRLNDIMPSVQLRGIDY